GLAKFLGFLPDTKAFRLADLARQYLGEADDIKQAANNILIDEDRARLRKLYDDLSGEVSQLLTPTERAELELRLQAQAFIGDNIRWDAVAITTTQLREFVRLSSLYQSMFRESFLSARQPPKEEKARRKAEFDKQVEKLFGPVHYTEYLRAQDPDFRETW